MNTSESKIDVVHIARLARIAVDPAELPAYERDLAAIFAHFGELAALPTENVSATARVIPSTNVEREDVVTPGFEREAFLAGAPAVLQGMVRVPRILAEEEAS